MKSIMILAGLSLLVLLPALRAEEEKRPLKLSDLPQAAAKAITDAAGGAAITEISLEDEDGTPAYEAVWTAKHHKHEITVAKDGTVLSLEETVMIDEVPEAVRAAITKESAGGKLVSVEKVEEKGKTCYEAVIRKDKEESEVTLDAQGKILDREEKSESKDEEKEEKEEKAKSNGKT